MFWIWICLFVIFYSLSYAVNTARRNKKDIKNLRRDLDSLQARLDAAEARLYKLLEELEEDGK